MVYSSLLLITLAPIPNLCLHAAAYFAAISILLLVILIANVQPFKQPLAHYSKINFTLLALLSVIVCGLEYQSTSAEYTILYHHWHILGPSSGLCSDISCLLDFLSETVWVEVSQ